ncbi:hypothetical protein EC957_004535 [Mortierella hygrophila]|uniref:F-box domain-containing protein n=1 Tax=Mortierella hygrophila TaxID=979708 RepID=A0A9P6FFY7_9FUNG|nr:hypothetical protein EC957_004535 [Mortierella hygrophila]
MNSAKPSPPPSLATFSCPELCHIIAQYLNQTDLYRCLLVNKTFSKNLHSFFWRHISFSDWVPYYSELYYLDKKQKELGLSGVDASEDKTSTSASSTSHTPKRERQERPVINRRIPNPWAATVELHDESELFLPPQPPFASLALHGHLVEILTLEWDEGQDFLPQPETAERLEFEEAPGVTQTWIYIRLLQQCPNIRALKIMGRNTELPWIWPKGMCGNGLEMEIHAKGLRKEAIDRCLAKVICAAGLVGEQQRLAMSALDGEGEGRGGGEAKEQVRARTEVQATTGQGIVELYLSNSCGFSHESFKALIHAFAPPLPAPLPAPHPTFPLPIAASQLQDDSPLSSLPPRPQLRILDISACEHIHNYQMITLLDRFPGLQVVDFRCREYLAELFADSGLHFDGSHQKSEQAKKFAGTKTITTPSMLWDDDGGDQRITYKPWSSEESLRVLRTGIASVAMRKDRLWRGPFTPHPAPTQPGEGPFDPLSGLEYPACFEWLYNHLARLTNLRELCLVSVMDPFMHDGGVARDLQFTVEEGLERLGGLRRLEVLDVEYLSHQIGVVEMQWMVKHWPMLKVIRGLIFEEDAEEGGEGVEEKGWSEGVRWLKMTRPDIELPVLEKRWKGFRHFGLG